ncbi:putative membrane protein [Paenibacillus shirakamiensis]|uniref:Membrane protein n=1 Tax=Paenibacillus shirakamiensis TaxID=1265935 RepID=A0ABS4JFN1_9BACL|nr:DUF1003 domain-containing protein [Paenibacillus shirakamiensis]MBP2000512.1 putative membrane protein [Paenibacillus shirakamiensis]
MGKKHYHIRKQPSVEASAIQGFDIELNKNHTARIDRLVDHYEKSILAHLDDEYIRKTRWPDRVADTIASFGGSWKFMILFALFLSTWLIWNTVPFTHHYDGPPFILLNLCLSFVAAFQAPIIMMSQNRQAARDKHESIIDFAINYKAESEIDEMQTQLHRIEDDLIFMKELLINLEAKDKVET